MPLVLNEEQSLLKSTAEDFFRRKAPVSALRALRDEKSVDGFSRELWREIVTMGWPGAFLPEQYGGLDCGFIELGVVLQASGRTLVASPLFSSVVLAASGILLFESGFVGVLGPMQREAEDTAKAVAGQLDPALLGVSLGAEKMTIWILLAVATANVVLGVWRPYLIRRRTGG